MKYTDGQRLEKILDYATKLHGHIVKNHISRDMVMNEEATQWLVTTPLYNIGEHVYNLSDEFKKAHGEVQWGMISGMRHRLVHNYEGMNWSIIVDVLYDELPVFVEQIKRIQNGNG